MPTLSSARSSTPTLVDGVFDAEAVRIETETQARRLEAEFNSKRLYCVRQARRKFFGDSPAGIELGGYPGELVHVTPASLKAEYDRILSSATIDVMVQGADEARVADLLLQKLQHLARQPQPFAAPMGMPAAPVQHYREEIPRPDPGQTLHAVHGGGQPQPAQCQHPAGGHERAGRFRHQPAVPQRAGKAVAVLLLRVRRPSGPPA